ncbi:MAG: hypothetical protein P4L51_14710 [Puia sp.]|nr:hypothetical protein [Puia sp.]
MTPFSELVDLPNVPPALPLLLNEIIRGKTWKESRKRIKDMMMTLREQSEGYAYGDALTMSYNDDPAIFNVHLHGALDLLSGAGCMSPECRINSAKRLASSIGLIADRVWLSDTLSSRFINFGRITNAKLDEIISDVLVLSELFPLIKDGIVRFSPPVRPTCTSCIETFDEQVLDISQSVAHVFRRDFRIKSQSDGGYSIYTGKCFEPPLIMTSVDDSLNDVPPLKIYTRNTAYNEINSILWSAREASISKGSILSNSRIALSGLLHQEGRLLDRRNLLFLDNEREFSIPWVAELSPSQIIELRYEVSKTLPLLRALLAKSMAYSDTNITQPNSIIDQLKYQAEEVRTELELKKQNSFRLWRTTYSILGLGLSAYGVTTQQIPAAIGGLLPIINLLITHKTNQHSEMSKLLTRPGYVLVKAKDILTHSH